MPDYEIILWDQSRFDIHSVKFVEDACKARKWAFAADYIRLYVLYHEGGIYLDSDVKVFRKFDAFLHHSAFSAIEFSPTLKLWRKGEEDKYLGYSIQAAIIGAEKGNAYIKMCLDHYNKEKEFKMTSDGELDVEFIPVVMARIAHQYWGFQYDLPLDTTQYLKDNLVIYPPIVLASVWIEINMKTYAVHICDSGWDSKPKTKIREFYRQLCGSYRFLAMMHWKRKNLQERIASIFIRQK
ncbi:MAG: Mannosyltransferase OCH1 [Bacteroidales bacterium]